MLIVRGDDISNDVITLGAYYYVFFNVCVHSRSLPLRADWRIFNSSVDGEPGELEAEFKFQRRSCKPFFLFPPRHQSASGSLFASVSDPKQYHNQAP